MRFLSLWCMSLLFTSIALCAEPQAKSHLSATEDLMREHGVLNRVLLIYQEMSRRMTNRIAFPPEVLQESVHITRDFLEDFHAHLEEKYVFPQFEKAQRDGALIQELIKQHRYGRTLTDYVLAHSSVHEIQDAVHAMVLAGYLDIYARLFRPHEARESSELFPNFSSLISREEYDRLGVLFETEGEAKFGPNGYSELLEKLNKIEKTLGISL